jgi:hypothetical protein
LTLLGNQGSQGSQSSTNRFQGFQGFQGRQGRQGFQGFQGFQGTPPTLPGVTGSWGYQGFQGYQSGTRDLWTTAYQALGSSVLSTSLSVRWISSITTSYTLVNSTLILTAVYVSEPLTITGAMWYQVVQGSYLNTSNNYNGIGLYSYSSGTCTLLTSTTSSTSIWQASANSWNKQAFSSSTFILSGVYFIGGLWNTSSGSPTAPTIGASTANTNAATQSFNFTNSAKIVSISSTTYTSIPTSFSMSSTTGIVNNPYFGLY